MNDKGHPDDWGDLVLRSALIQVQEKPRVHEMKDGKFFGANFLFYTKQRWSDHHTISPFDLKDGKKAGKRPIGTITKPSDFSVKNVGEECRRQEIYEKYQIL